MKFTEEYKKFIDEWGYEAQSRICVEEMSELIKELCKIERYKNDPERKKEIIQNVKEEIADVLNVVEQMEYHYGIEEIESIREEKIKRTLKRL